MCVHILRLTMEKRDDGTDLVDATASVSFKRKVDARSVNAVNQTSTNALRVISSIV